ncbi:hypothetical protein AMK26_30110 [Streptomyces sp. CB03234]|uniref:Rieske (2Fe-2S) protein n=1 Tax=Streptomyces sp. (strain CB03234) TaxID=1703937 RepID=UPI00093E3498|nr:Rieske (2Fe-2S) protein [Streptomyces sp. CB03234]OKJ97078.1 hypothetical protein AMK26_30110 [Streptomyces sp. CB03234]
MTTTPTPRRTVLAAAASVTAALVAGCGDDNGAAPPATATSPGPELAGTADIPAGGGRIFKDRKVVVTQPQEGEFKAFSAVCTHQACVVATVEDGTINCACHGSRFRIADGSVARGPATRPLPAEQITVTGDSIRLT